MNKTPIEPLKIGINAIKKSHKQQNKWQKTFDEMFNGHFVPTYSNILESGIIEILKTIYNDKETLEWWIYEMDFGAKCSDNSLTDENGKNIPIKSIEDLYRFYEKYTLKK